MLSRRGNGWVFLFWMDIFISDWKSYSVTFVGRWVKLEEINVNIQNTSGSNQKIISIINISLNSVPSTSSQGQVRGNKRWRFYQTFDYVWDFGNISLVKERLNFQDPSSEALLLLYWKWKFNSEKHSPPPLGYPRQRFSVSMVSKLGHLSSLFLLLALLPLTMLGWLG